MKASMNRQRLFGEAAVAVVAGLVATIPMSAVMLASGGAGRMGTQPPRRVVDEAVERTPGSAPSDGARTVGAGALHLLLGGLMAVGGLPLIALLRGIPGPLPRGVASGGVFGASLYAVNYAGLAPALGILPPPSKDRAGRQLTMVVAHLVYGVVVGVLVSVLAPGRDRGAR